MSRRPHRRTRRHDREVLPPGRYEPEQPRSPDELLRDAWAIRRLLHDLDDDEHESRIRLVAARDVLRLEAAQQWHDRGWRSITDSR